MHKLLNNINIWFKEVLIRERLIFLIFEADSLSQTYLRLLEIVLPVRVAYFSMKFTNDMPANNPVTSDQNDER